MERRAYSRYATGVEVVVTHTSGLRVEATGVNLSGGGMRLIFGTDMVPVVDEEYEVVFTIPGCTSPTINRVVVRWTDRIRPYECGVQFLAGLRAIEMFAVINLPKDPGGRA